MFRRGVRAVPPPACVEALTGLSNQPRSQRRASPRQKVSDENVYSSFHIPTVSSYGPALLFLHALAPLDSCEGLRRPLRGTWHSLPSVARHAEPVAKQVGSKTAPPPTKTPAPPLRSHGSLMTPLPQRHPDHFQVTPTGLAHPSPAVSQNNNMPKYCRHSKRPRIF